MKVTISKAKAAAAAAAAAAAEEEDDVLPASTDGENEELLFIPTEDLTCHNFGHATTSLAKMTDR